MANFLKFLLSILIVVASIFGGAVLGFFGTFLVCIAIDAVLRGSDFGSVGWVFCFMTVPAGGFCGLIFSVLFVYRWWRSDDQQRQK